MNTSHDNRRLDDIDVREEETVVGVVAGARIEFSTFTEGEYVESVLIDRIRAKAIYRDLGRILGGPFRMVEALRNGALFIRNSILNSSSVVEGQSSNEARGMPAGDRRDDQKIAEVHSILVASTAHVTAREAQSLTDHGYCRGEIGWFFYVGQNGPPDLADLESLSGGLGAVVRQAQERGCHYVLLDRDANPLSGIPTYDW
jgi:hypothetical protein